MVFSKQFNRDVFSQPPIVGTEVNIDIPCFGPDRESLVVGKASALSGQNYTALFPYENERTVETCPVYPWLPEDIFDYRHSMLGVISLSMLQESNGVLAAMSEKLPASILAENTANLEARQSIPISVFNRRRYVWDINCERSEGTSSTNFYQTLHGIRQYFYSAVQQIGFSRADHIHKNQSVAEHDDYHSLKFHIHL